MRGLQLREFESVSERAQTVGVDFIATPSAYKERDSRQEHSVADWERL